MRWSDAAEADGGRGPQVNQEAEASRDAYVAGRDQFILHAQGSRQCSCGFYAVGTCHVCDIPLCGEHGASFEGLLLCGSHRHAAVLEKEQRGREGFRPRYIHQVMQVFAGELLDRDAELAELSAFAVSDDGCPYAWWQGDAWTGKSALMASFVLNPPPGVRVVSFFITARFARQSDRAAFLEAVLSQLSELLGQSTPTALTESNQQVWFLELLEQAAAKCAREGCQLALVVDGLDEDRGMLVSGDVHSIAALLPGNPPAGVRIILASRPVPPVPADVAAWHPLNGAEIVRSLRESTHAVIVRGDTRRELARLLDGESLGRELLGLVVTAGGGIASEDLAELADEPPGEIERILHTVTGRTFTIRERQWGTSPGHVFVLAHEELQRAALRSLRGPELMRWRNRIHAWANSYRDHGWPADTPEYLLRGYLRMLRDIGDLPRMVALSTDLTRLDRMLDISGGDAAALTDIMTVLRHIRNQPHPDLAASLRLSYTRYELIKRNSSISPHLPAVWAALGNFNRAQALTQSIEDPDDRAQALGYLSMAVAEAGNAERAARLLEDAESTARSILSPLSQSLVLASLCSMIVGTGDLRRAENMTGSISENGWKDHALASLSAAYAQAGDASRAKTIAMSSSDAMEQASALAAVAQVLAEAGDLSQAGLMADAAEAAARSATEAWCRSPALASAAQAAAVTGNLVRARRLIDDAEAIARSLDEEADKDWVLGSLASAAAKTGDLDRAENILRMVTDQFRLASTLRSWSEVAVASGDLERAETIARSIPDPSQQAPALERVSEAVARHGDVDRAEVIALSIIQVDKQASALAWVAHAALEAGESGRARKLAEKAEALARSAAASKDRQVRELAAAAHALADAGAMDQALLLAEKAETVARLIDALPERASALTLVASAVAAAGELDKAETIARSINHEGEQGQALAAVAQIAAGTGDLDRARRLIGDAEISLASTGNSGQPSIAIALAESGNLEEAARTARAINNEQEQASTLASVARAAVEAGNPKLARLLVRELEQIIGSLDSDQRDWPLEALSRALIYVGKIEQAETTARSISHPYPQGSAFAALTAAVAEHGDLRRAEVIAESITEPHARGQSLASIAQELAKIGNLDKARDTLAEALISAHPFAALSVLSAIDSSTAKVTVRHFLKTQEQPAL